MLTSNLDISGQNVLEALLKSVEQNFPANSVYLDVADGELHVSSLDTQKMIDDLENQLSYAAQLGMSREELLAVLLTTEPYSRNDELKATFTNGEDL